MELLETILEFARAGFDQVNAVQGLIIALVAALLLPSWRRLPIFAVGAAAVHVAVDVLLPVVTAGAGPACACRRCWSCPFGVMSRPC